MKTSMATMPTAIDALASRLAAIEKGYFRYVDGNQDGIHSPKGSLSPSSPLSAGRSRVLSNGLQISPSHAKVEAVGKVEKDDTKSDQILQAPRMYSIQDPYSASFYQKLGKSSIEGVRRPPIINRGSYARYRCMDILKNEYLSFITTNYRNSSPGKHSHISDDKVVECLPPSILRYRRQKSYCIDCNCNCNCNCNLDVRTVQILNLGAGYDTFGLQLLQHYRSRSHEGAADKANDPWDSCNIAVYEIDFLPLIQTKSSIIHSSDMLNASDASPYSTTSTTYVRSLSRKLSITEESSESLNEEEEEEEEEAMKVETNPDMASSAIDSSGDDSVKCLKLSDGVQYVYTYEDSTVITNNTSVTINMIGCDICDTGRLHSLLTEYGFDPKIPTLILSECVLVYLEKEQTENILNVLGGLCEDAAWISFDMVNPNDAFGRMMLSNIKTAGKFIDYKLKLIYM